jgi:hypothetical protein
MDGFMALRKKFNLHRERKQITVKNQASPINQPSLVNQQANEQHSK